MQVIPVISMALELFGSLLADGVGASAGAKVRENSDKKKLQEAEGDPEKTDQIHADIDKREKDENRLILFMLVFALFVVIAAN